MNVSLSRQPSRSSASRAEVMRQALAQRAMSSTELAEVAGVSSKAIGAFLRYDLEAGRVRVRGSRPAIYELSAVFDDDLQRRLYEAKSLLSQHGYIVRKATHRKFDHA
jgi:hypothetical protein